MLIPISYLFFYHMHLPARGWIPGEAPFIADVDNPIGRAPPSAAAARHRTPETYFAWRCKSVDKHLSLQLSPDTPMQVSELRYK